MKHIPLSVLRDLRCRHCSKFVNCGPVHVIPNDGSILCGRCRLFAKSVYRNFAYEALAEIFFYPCCYWEDHCNTSLAWNDSLIHEYYCKYQSKCRVFWSKPHYLCKGDRRLPDGGDVILEHLSERTVEKLVCQVCQNYLSFEPVYIGPNGRHICHRCVISNGVPNDYIQDLAYEKLASITIFPCIYRNRGCPIRIKFGRAMWYHETECSYGQINKRISVAQDGKERGVIETHSGHIWGTITPHSALFAPSKSNKNDVVTQEFFSVIKKKKDSSSDGSVDEYESLGSIGDLNNSRPLTRRSSKQSANYSRDLSIASSKDLKSIESRASVQSDYRNNLRYSIEIPRIHNLLPEQKSPYLLNYSPSFNFPPPTPIYEIHSPKRSESLRVGNQDLIDELKVRQKLKEAGKDNPYSQCNSLQDIVKVQESFN